MTEELAGQPLPAHFDHAIARSDELMLLGDYDAALSILESLERDSPCTIEQNREILRAKARTWVARGYPQRAKECMREACALPREALNQQQILILEVHAAFVIIVACGEEPEDDEVLFQARELLCPMPALTSFSPEAVGSHRHWFGSEKSLIY